MTEFGYIKDKNYRALVKNIEISIDRGIKSINLEPSDFEWVREYLKFRENLTQFYYRGVLIKKLIIEK